MISIASGPNSHASFWMRRYAQVAATILGSREYKTLLVENYYLRFLLRAPDPQANQLVGMLLSGTRDEDVIAILLSSAEYVARV